MSEKAIADFLSELGARTPAQVPATFGEIWKTDFDAAGLDTFSGVNRPFTEAREELAGAIASAAGMPVEDYAARQNLRLGGVTRDQDIAALNALADTLPDDAKKAVEPFRDVRKRASDKAAAIEKEAADLAARTYGLTGVATAFLAGMARQAVDPINLATIGVGGPLTGGVARMLGREALLGAGIQAAQEPVIQAGRAELGLEAGFGEGAGNVLEAGLGAAGLAGVFRAAGAGLRMLRRPAQETLRESTGAIIPAEGRPAPDFPETRVPEPPTGPAGSSEVQRSLDELTPEDFAAAERLAGRDQVMAAQAPADPEARLAHDQAVETAAQAIERGPLLPEPRQLRQRVVAGDGRAIEVEAMVVEASALKTSADAGFDPALQPRQRDRAASQQQIREIAGALDPERLGFSAEADRGAPIIGSDLMVESGNGRVMALRQVYAAGGEAAERYRAFIAAQGFDLTGFREPVLVRRRVTELAPDERAQFTLAANQSATLMLSASERALADARVMNDDMLALLRNADDLGAAANRDFVRAFVGRLPQTEQGSLVTAEGALSSEGLLRIRNAVLARAYGNAPVLARIAEATADEVKSISNALVSAAPHWARLRAAIAAGDVRPDVDITPQLVEAVGRTADLRAKGGKLADYLAQQDAFERISEPVEAFMRAFYNKTGRRAASAENIAEFLRFYAEEARKVSGQAGLDLGLAPVTARDILRVAANRTGDAGSEQTTLFAGADDRARPGDAAGRRGPQRAEPDRSRAQDGTRGDGGAEPGAAGPVQVLDLGDPALKLDADRALAETGDLDLVLQNPDGTTRTVKASEALREAEEDAAAAAELVACIGKEAE